MSQERITDETITELLATRVTWLHVGAVERNGGYDIVLRLDGTYYGGGDLMPDPDEMTDYWRELVGQALVNSGIDMSRRRSWDKLGKRAWLEKSTAA